MAKRKSERRTNTTGRTTRERVSSRATPTHVPTHVSASARELYRREKERRASANRVADPLAEARRAYLALLEAEAGTARGGRPRKHAKRARAAPVAGTEDESGDEAAGRDED